MFYGKYGEYSTISAFFFIQKIAEMNENHREIDDLA